MATIQLMSDLHLEFLSASRRKAWYQRQDSTGVDILILAGDICTEALMPEVLTALCWAYPQVVYLTGNHEYYNRSTSVVQATLRRIEGLIPNLHWLDNRSITLEGLLIVGGTLWFPRPTSAAYLSRTRMNDYRVIQDFEPWVYAQNQICEAVLGAVAGKADVVVTHHIPSISCVSPRYRAEGLMNHYFCRDLTEKIETWQPALWCFGHTHDRMTSKIGSTLLVANPLGYPHEPESEERGAYVERCLIEVNSGDPTAQIRSASPGPGLAENRLGGGRESL